jgi:DNA-binding SARP family transcriptional activator
MEMPEFRVLGPLEVIADDGVSVPLGGTKQRAVLAVLVLRAGEVVSAESLIDDVWGEQPPRTASTSLQNAISALRRLLGPGVVLTRAPGYMLAVDADQVDVRRFERLLREAAGHEAGERVRLLREALDLWRGEPLAELAFEPFAAAEIRRLEELRLVATEDLIDAGFEDGRDRELVPQLESLVARHPLRERLRGQLMLALYRSGRQADALAAYQDARRSLLEELGLDPGPQLQQLHASILRQEIGLQPPPATASPEDHVEQVARLLLEGRLVPVLGTDVAQLASGLAARFEYPFSEGSDLTRVAQYVALTKGSGPLYDELRAMLEASAGPTAVHRFFAALPHVLRTRGLSHPLIVTTSYDLALEQALLDAGEEFDVVAYVASGRDRGRFCHRDPSGGTRVIEVPNTYASELSLDRRTVVLKLHGGLDDGNGRGREAFVVTEDDYIGYLASGDLGVAIPVGLAARLRRSHFLFLGYGMREWGLRLVLDRMCGGEPFAYRSWAVVPAVQPLERQHWRSRDVDLLEQALDEYVAALARYVGVENAKATA